MIAKCDECHHEWQAVKSPGWMKCDWCGGVGRQIATDYVNRKFLMEQTVITKKAMIQYFGEPCEYYRRGCGTCDGWDLWARVTGEAIEYTDHDCWGAWCKCSEGKLGTKEEEK